MEVKIREFYFKQLVNDGYVLDAMVGAPFADKEEIAKILHADSPGVYAVPVSDEGNSLKIVRKENGEQVDPYFVESQEGYEKIPAILIHAVPGISESQVLVSLKLAKDVETFETPATYHVGQSVVRNGFTYEVQSIDPPMAANYFASFPKVTMTLVGLAEE